MKLPYTRAVCYACATLLLQVVLSCKITENTTAQSSPPFDVIAYYAGDGSDIGQYRFDQLSQVIFSFCHLKGNRLRVDDAQDSTTIRKLVTLKKELPKLKILLSLGGWCGCEPCSGVFATAAGRAEFAESVWELLQEYEADGLDLDWEYPGIEGCPGHAWARSDREHFTALIRELRRVLGDDYELSFAAGGFPDFFDYAIEWDQVMPLVNRVNIMTYDLVSGFSTVTGHHTPLYSNDRQLWSTDYAVRYLDSLGVPRQKMVIGAAFYARTWSEVEAIDNGIYQSGKFKHFISYRHFEDRLSAQRGFIHYRDTTARAPFAYNPATREFATFDDALSVKEKTRYALDRQLGGIMFWQLTGDKYADGLLQVIYDEAYLKKNKK